MSEIVIKKLSGGAEGCHIPGGKFKTSHVSVNLFVKKQREYISGSALLSSLLLMGSADYPDYTSLNRRLSELYGATLYGDVSNFGDMQIVKFVISVIDDKYTLNGEQVLLPAADLLLSMIFDPPLQNGLFKESDFVGKKRLLIEQIEGEINNKRSYAVNRTEEAMYKGQAAGLSKYGSLEAARVLRNEDAVKAHKFLLENAFVRVNVVSGEYPSTVFEKITDYLSKIERNVEKVDYSVPHKFSGEVKTVEEQMDVSQGKLCMAFSISGTAQRKDSVKAALFCDMLGGGPYSRLFLNVREKQSLCYYCSVSRFDPRKGAFIVESGIAQEDKQKAIDSIKTEVKALQDGDFTDSDLSASKMATCNGVASVGDSAGGLDAWYITRAYYEGETPEKFIEMINGVTRQDIIDIACGVNLDTVYFLGGSADGKGGGE